MSAHTHCRVCKNALPEPFFDLGMMPLANAFLSSKTECQNEKSFPLAVSACELCGLAQLNYVVPAEQLYRNYIYVSSTSEAVRVHVQALANMLMERCGLGVNDLVLEVASNDGTALREFQKLGMRVLGVEPARNIAAVANENGVNTVAEFFNASTAQDLVESHGRVSAILARHVFAHVDDVHDFLNGIQEVLAKEGVFVIEVPYWGDLVDNVEFDTIYHEHLSYFSLGSLSELCDRHDLRIVDIERIGLHGGSVLVFVKHRESTTTVSDRVHALNEVESKKSYSSLESLARFTKAVMEWRVQFEDIVKEASQEGTALIGYGAAAKGNTLLNFCPDVARVLTGVLDRSPHKQGHFTPGTHLPVMPVEMLRQQDVSHMVILAWNFREEIMRQMQSFSDNGGRFIIPLPEPNIF